jgi:hypothetical protein
MGFATSTMSYTTWQVLAGPLPEHRQDFLDGLVRGRIGGIDVDVGRDRAGGFAIFDDPLNTGFLEANVFFDPLVLFCFRMDKLTVPASTLKLYIRKRLNENLAATRRERMPRAEREELIEQVRHDLLRKAIPAIAAYDVVWDTVSGRLRLFSTSAAVREEFVARCHEYLGLEMRCLDTVGVLESRLDERELIEAVHLLPFRFGIGGALADGEEEA